MICGLFSNKKKKTNQQNKYQDYILTPNNTVWVFLSGSSDPRHLFDIILGVHSLRRLNVPDNRIFIFVDHPQASIHLGPYGVTQNILDATKILELPSLVPSTEHIFLFVTGHGKHDGIPLFNRNSVAPQKILDAVRSVPQLKTATLAFGQCYAGVFNYMNVRHELNKPQVCILGATNLHLSLSSGITLNNPIIGTTGTAPLTSWSANIFLFYLINWLLSPSDIDGDSRSSLMDAYKYAGVCSNECLRGVKVTLGHDLDHWLILTTQQIRRANPPLPQMVKQALLTQINEKLNILNLHQEPWILHADIARHIFFDFGNNSVATNTLAN